MYDVKLKNSEKELNEKDFKLVEEDLSIKIPDSFKRFYLCANGGDPNKTYWIDSTGKFDHMEIRDFMSIRYRKVFKDDPDYTLNGIAKTQWAEGVLPKNLLPFAMDWGGNYFCIDHQNEKVYLFVRDVWSDNLSKEENLDLNSKFLCESFDDFLSNIHFEDDIEN